MIVTRKKQIPYHWIAVAIMPWAAGSFAYSAMGNTFLFSLKKFVENPAGLTFILSFPSYISIFLWPACAFLSDRIWTRVGRRKPFIVVSWIGMFACLLVMPLMSHLWSLVLVYMLFMMSSDISAPLEPLKQEIVPPHQRGFSTAAMSWVGNILGLLFAYFAIGRFDDVRFLSGRQVTGETLLYWSGVLVLLVTFFVVTLAIKEINPHSAAAGRKLSLRSFFSAILDRDLWPVYLLIFGSAMLNAGLGPLGNLLYTDQWNYTKQDMGTNIAVGGVLNIFVIGGLAFIADRLDRMRAYQVLITLSLGIQFFYYLYVEFILPDQRPSLVEIIFFGETLSILGILTGMIYVPLVYDYIVRDKMGTYNAGAGLLNRITGIITLNLVGLFVSAYGYFFQPPSGEMARICLDHPAGQAEINAILRQHAWKTPEGTTASASAVSARPWYTTGIVSNTGNAWEIRLRDPKSAQVAAQMEDLQDQLNPVLAREKSLQDQAEIDRLQRLDEAAQTDQKEAAAQKVIADELQAKVNQLQSELAARSDTFHQQVVAAFQPLVLQDGRQVATAQMEDGAIITVPVAREAGAALEKTLVDLRRIDSRVIDVRRARQNGAPAIAVSLLSAKGADAGISALSQRLPALLNRREPGLVATAPHDLAVEHATALVLTLRTVDPPLDNRVSPITRVVNDLLGLIDAAPQPERHLAAAARSLRRPGETEQVGLAAAGTVQDPQISAVALLLPGAARSPIDDAVTKELRRQLGSGATADQVAQARAFYDRVAEATAAQGVTVEQPLLAHRYTAMRYDYMSGYIPIFLLGLVGLFITVAFRRREARGLIRKLGVEEAEAS